ncbi:hypothetical protein [Ruminococcus sp. NK3A76]|uniref:hypothetical protein n=1 Tax=Ruminococcus sp. NK3A76 TaxID=877411 RepID=UPI00048F772E|nr:hypothetical protein [Ruminococcus sp. NK3A76]
MKNYLKIDPSMPKEYNKGVMLIRVGVSLAALLILVILSYIFIYSPPPLTYVENRSYTVVKTYTVKRTGSSRGSSNKYRYWLTLRDDETGKEHEWYVKESVLNSYTEGQTVSLPVYSIGDSGKKFLSLENNTDEKEAKKEYYDSHPTMAMKIYMYSIMLLITAVVGCIGGGIEETAKAGRHVFLPMEIPEDSEAMAIKQPDYDDIFK